MHLVRDAFGLFLLLCAGCQQLLDLSDYQIDASLSPALQACADAALCEPRTDASSRAGVQVSKQCPIVYGASTDPRSVRIGAIFDLSGQESAVGAMQAHSSELAIEQLNSAGGLRLRGETEARPVTLFICDRALDARAAVRTLEKLGVSGLIGPAWPQSLAEVASDTGIPQRLMLLGPSALSDAGQHALSWGMTLSEADRVPMLLSQLRALALQRSMQPRPLALALVMRADGPMTSVRISQAQLAPLDHGPMIDLQQSVVSYEYRDAKELAAIAAKLAAKPADIVIADGASEVADLIATLERMLGSEDSPERPYYLLSEAAQGPKLLLLAEEQPQLQARVSMIGAVPTEEAQSVYAQFEEAYRERYAEAPRAVSGIAATYSAVYAFAFGLMAASDEALHSGPVLAHGLRQLTGGALQLTTASDSLNTLSEAIANNGSVNVTGTLGALSWTEQGTPRGALVGVYCLGRTDDGWGFVSTGYRYNIASGALGGTALPCAAWQADAVVSREKTDAPSSARAASSSSETKASSDMDAGAPAADGGEIQSVQDERELTATDIGLSVQYYPLNNSPFDSVVGPAIKIINRSATEPIPLCSLRARYYLTNEHADACPADCTIDGYYSGLQPSGMTTPAQRSYHEAGPESPSAYLEISFPCTHVTLGVGESVEVQQQFHTEPYRDFDETNDYSFRVFPTSYADSELVTLYHEGKLVWGTPPR